MPRKRKAADNQTTSDEPPQKQQQVDEQQQQPQNEQQQEDDEEYEEEVEEYEEEEEVDDDEEENENENTQSANNQNSSAVTQSEDEEPIPKLLEPFTKDQLVSLLKEAADVHPDVSERIRKMADEDPVHRKIFVHGLRWDTTAETLIDEFKQYGEIEECKAVVDKVSGKSKGYAFILFKSRKGARNALKEPQKKINNRMTSCQLASVGPVPKDKGEVVSAAVSSGQQESEYTRRKIYVSNVGADLDPKKLTEFFSKYGEIEDGPLGLDKATGRPKGFCLFVYKSFESAKKALEEPHKTFEGHVLHCQRAIDGPKPGKGKQQQQQQPQPPPHQNSQGGYFQRNENPGFVGGAGVGQGHLMAPSGPGVGFNQGVAAAQALNPALGQALTALLSNPAAGLGLTNLLGTIGSAGVPGAGPALQGGYGAQQGVMGAYGSQGMQGGYGNQPMGSGGAGRGQPGVGQYGGAPHNMGR